jgi:diaminopimelate decarboxylase
VPGAHVLFNGPGKTKAELAAAAAGGALIVIDGFDELDAVAALAETTRRGIRVGLRCDLGESAWSRFGFRAGNGDARRALERIAAKPMLELEALHHHAGTDHRDPAPYLRAAQGLVRLKREAESLGLSPATLDLGGGFPANRALAPFAAAIAEGLAGEDVAIVLEPGRAVVDPAMWLLCTVVATKEISGLGRAAVVDAGINALPLLCRSAPRPVLAVRGTDLPRIPTSVFGPLCMPEDRIAEAANLPPLSSGDPLVVAEAGAYTLSQATQFASPRPAVVLVNGESAELVRRREDWRDVLGTCALPERLRPSAPGRA